MSFRRPIGRRPARPVVSRGSVTIPAVQSLSSSSGSRWSGAKSVDITCTGMSPGAQAQVDGVNVTTVYNSPTSLTITLPDTALWENGTRVVTVVGATGSQNYVVSYGSTILAEYDPAAGITITTGVSAWIPGAFTADANKTAVQGDTTAQPVFVPSSANWNGKPCLQFDGTNDRLRTSAWTVQPTQPRTRIMAFRPISVMNKVPASSTTTGNPMYFFLDPSGFVQINAGTGMMNTPFALGQNIIFAAEFDGAASRSRGNSLTPNAAGNAGTNSAVGLVIGAWWNDAFPINGEIAGVVELAGKDNAMIRQIVSWYGAKFNMVISP